MDVAITVDDLPGSDKEASVSTRIAITHELLGTFKKYRITKVHGFVNAVRLEEAAAAREIMETWTLAGHPLGNHTYSHLDLDRTEIKDYLDDIQRNDERLSVWQNSSEPKIFRFPYLNGGNNQEKLEAVRKYLQRNRYFISEVTIDFADWRWNRLTPERHSAKSVDEFVDSGAKALQQARTLGMLLMRRPIKHVLVLHFGAFTAKALAPLLEAYQKLGVRFISLAEANTDKIYELVPMVLPNVGTLLNKLSRARSSARLKPVE